MKIYFIGIGGIGISALARYYFSKNNEVTGSDIERSEITDDLQKSGIEIYLGQHDKKRIKKDLDLVIYSAAIPNDNLELKQANSLGIKTFKYSEALGEITKEYFTICVSGTHGKSTTTAMLSLLLIEAGLDPTVILGTKLKEFNNTNFHKGSDRVPDSLSKPLLLIEADEWQASFLNYHPDIIIVNNIEEEHLDFYKDLSDILKTFEKFINKLPKNGSLVLNKDDQSAFSLKDRTQKKVSIRFYSKEDPDFTKINNTLKVPGKHNVYNALAAFRVGQILKVSEKNSLNALRKYTGAWRRYDIRKTQLDQNRNITIINDYAHHPTEIKSFLEGVRKKFSDKNIWTVFQPHQKQRTHYLFDKFVSAFDKTDNLILTDIYEVQGREPQKHKTNSKKLFQSIKKHWQAKNKPGCVYYLSNKQAIVEFLRKNFSEEAVLIIMGAGDIYKINEILEENY